jgi:pSer/pThr/pTyr-binding forkhead associated (FHA) protein
MPTLIIQERETDENFNHSCLEDVVTLGRLDNNVVQLCSKGVSRHHAKIISDAEDFFIIDLGSGNGTVVNGITITPQEKSLLQFGDIITIDKYDIRFQTDNDPIETGYNEEITESDILEVKLLKKVLTALDKDMVPSLEVLNGSAEGKKVFLTDEVPEIVVGRDPECEFPINEYVISRRHAKVIKRWGGIAIRDLESKNGSFVNNRRVVEEYLHDGDRIALGTIVLMFRNPQEINLAQLDEARPKNVPAAVSPDEIPGLGFDEESEEEGPDEGGEFIEEEDEVSSPMEEWDELEKSLSGIGQAPYPTPQARVEAIKQLTPVEIGMIGLGALVLIFALITIVNLMTS